MTGWAGPGYLAFIWGMFGLTTIFTVVRLYVQFRQRKRRLRELWVIASWIVYLAMAITTSLLIDFNAFNYEDESTFAPDWYTDKQIDRFYEITVKLHWVQGLIWKTGIYFCKAALLLFFADLSPPMYFPKTWWTIRLTWVLVICGCLFQISINLFACWPFYLNWSTMNGGCAFRKSLMVTSMVFHIVTDVLVYGIPFAIFNNLKNLTKKQRRGALMMFAVGGINAAFAFLKAVLYAINEEGTGLTENLEDAFYAADSFGSEMQSATALMVVCMPHMRRLYQLLYTEKQEKKAAGQLPSESSRKAGGASGAKSDVEAAMATTVTFKAKSSEKSYAFTSAAATVGDNTTVDYPKEAHTAATY